MVANNNSLNKRVALNDFLSDVQVKAYRHALLATGQREEALDIVQDAMMSLAKSYSERPNDWGPLFHRILQNKIKDWYKKQSRARNVFSSFFNPSMTEDSSLTEESESSNDGAAAGLFNRQEQTPEASLLNEQRFKKVSGLLHQLPQRQQQAFLLRAWWEKDVEEAAFAMQCSAGSVKTHYHRALQKLRELMGESGPSDL